MCNQVGKELVGWEIYFGEVVGLKIFTIDKIDKKYIYATYKDRFGPHQTKFSAKTGKEWRIKPWKLYHHLTKQGVKRL